ncbi:DUF986 family protein [Candidatus Hamiltonella defensa]|uniref:UPF0266 membrane protein HDEF_0156 n=1 Tax=Hamiltonella defensa subsp. Acyrthosiphon pisum (strain 5AT) TaxID=572265 RepID=C4K8U2_HAMD5|nr:DUF986 family protein [Candidatus Hamiltonella defensa]ACQ66929.1 putative membrane protein [Candidatus Hamiltonella defensa 5AT (Acyrthosiphon pisum)]ATW21730.1 hypothetical protein BJP44_00745 [Candidatus Hamiltonella defensa]
MSNVDHTLIIFIISFLIYAVYNEFILNFIKGKTILKVNLERKNKVDATILIGLTIIFIYNNMINLSSPLTIYLLFGLLLLIIYIFYIRYPKLIFKKDGFFYCNILINYKNIKKIKLSEDGILAIHLKKRSIFIKVVYFEDLKKMVHVFLEKTTF